MTLKKIVITFWEWFSSQEFLLKQSLIALAIGIPVICFFQPYASEDAHTKIKLGSTITYNEWLTYQIAEKDFWGKSIAGIVVVIGLIFTYHRLKLSHEEQMTNRFSKAVELLGHADISVRLGALYALERIANDSDKDYSVIIETISAYVRHQMEQDGRKHSENSYDQLREDVNAAINILTRRKYSYPELSFSNLDFSGLNLTSDAGDFANCNFHFCKFNHVKLKNIDFSNTRFLFLEMKSSIIQNCNFSETHLLEASLSDSHIHSCEFSRAELSYGKLTHVLLTNSSFRQAKLNFVDFAESTLIPLSEKSLKYADLKGANLRTVKGITWQHLSWAEDLENLQLSEDLANSSPEWYRNHLTQIILACILFRVNNYIF